MAPIEKTASAEEKSSPSFDQMTQSVDAVEALESFESSGASLTVEESKRILRKVDWHIMPLLCLVYGMQFLDKTSLSYASIMGIRTATNLSLSDYSWLSSIFYLGYLVGEYPTSYMLQRLPLAKWTSFNVIVWGGVLCCMAVAKNFTGLMIVRFVLGLLEASITPAFSLFTSQWYRTSEQGTRTGIWFSCNALSQIIGSCLAYGLAQADLNHSLALPGWKVVFILLGSVTSATGVLLLVFLPDTPLKARFLTADERLMAVERIRSNQQGIGNKTFKTAQVWEALTDPLTYLYMIFAVTTNIPNGGITNFFSILIQSFGYSTTQTLLYSAPAGAVVATFVVTTLYLGDRFKMRIAVSYFPLCVSIMGVSLIWALPSDMKVARLMGYYFASASTASFVVVLSLITSNVAGYTKKITVSALFLIAYCVGNLIGPQTFRAQDAPHYTPALATIVACCAFAIVLQTLIWWCYISANKKKALLRSAPGYAPVANQEFKDLTDRENEAFVYTY